MTAVYCPLCKTEIRQTNSSLCPSCGNTLILPPQSESLKSSSPIQQPQLLVQTASQSTQPFTMSNAQIQIGRDAQNDMVINNSIISRHHAQITREGAEYWLTDLNSANGTFLNGRALIPQQPYKIDNGANIRIGDQLGNSVNIIFQTTTQAEFPQLFVQITKQATQPFIIIKPITYIGRDVHNDLVINSPIISRQHARIDQQGTDYWLTDFGTVNGTFLNGRALAPQQPHKLENGSIIHTGDQMGNAVNIAFHVTSPGPQPQLLIQASGQSAQPFVISKPQILIGRDKQNDLVVNSAIMSRQHAKIELTGADYCVIDLNSANGTFLNGRALTPQKPYKLKNGAIIRVGDQLGNSISFTFQSATQQIPSNTIRLSQLNLGQLPKYTLGRDPANQVHLDHPSVSRRHAQVNHTPQGVKLRDLESANGTYVNGQRIKGVYLLRSNDVVQIGPYKLLYEQSGFTKIAPEGNYWLEAQSLTRSVTIGGFSQRLFNQTTQKVILRNVTLAVQPREFVALVGGSGAGKSTLMKAMSGFTPATSGRVLVNGDNLYSTFDAYRSILGYVPQDDIIHSQLPVSSALNYAAQLRLPDASPPEIQKRIQHVLEEVEMIGHEDKLVSQLSGGQRKRVSIAVELLAEPGLFFLDEPTSGLDPGLEKKMMYTMRRLADGGRTIVLVTHATSNIDRCTHVAFMADGELAYFGPPTDALRFFEATDFSDIYTKLGQTNVKSASLPAQAQPSYKRLKEASRDSKQPTASAVWADHYRHSSDYQQHVVKRLQHNKQATPAPGVNRQKRTGQSVSMIKQFGVLTQRYFELIRRDMQSLVILLAVMPLIGVLLLFMAEPEDLVGLESSEIRAHIQEKIDESRRDQDSAIDDEQFQGIYQVVGSTQRVLFIVALAGSLLGLFAASYEIVKEEGIYQRERMVNLKIPPYLLSKMAVLALFAFIQCALFLIVLRLKLIFPESGVIFPAAMEFFITLFLTTLASIALGLLISASVRSGGTVIYVILIVLFIQILFAGAIFELPAAAQPISYMTTTRWSLEALGNTANMVGLRDKGGGCLESEQELPPGMAPEATLYCREGQTTLPASYDFHVNYEHTPVHLFTRWLILAGFTVSLCLMTAFVQKRKDVISS